MESVMLLKPPRRVACSQAMLILIRTHKIRPGLSSLKDLTSNEPTAGLSSRPMKNYRRCKNWQSVKNDARTS